MGVAPLLEKAARILATAAGNAVDDPESAYVLANAARLAGTALRAQQGLRPTVRGHYAVEKVLRAQFGERFRTFATFRRRRKELEYPTFPGETTTRAEPEEAIATAHELLTASEQLLPSLGRYWKARYTAAGLGWLVNPVTPAGLVSAQADPEVKTAACEQRRERPRARSLSVTVTGATSNGMMLQGAGAKIGRPAGRRGCLG
jgi:hypothetical protein